MGDLDGRLYNGLTYHALPVNNPNPFGLFGGISPFLFSNEAGIIMSDDAHGIICNQQTWTQPSKLVPSWYQKQLQDIGVISPVEKYPLKCKKETPNFDDNTTWRDLALEHAITHNLF